MIHFTFPKWLNVVGGVCQLAGLCCLSMVDIAAMRATKAAEEVRSTAAVERFDAALKDMTYEPSTQEIETETLETAASRKSKRWFNLGLKLVFAGTTLQLAGAITGD